MNVQDLMQKNVITVAPQTSLKEVGRLIFGNRINALPVVDNNKKLVGIITDKDVIAKFYPSFEDYIDDYVHAKNFNLMEEKAGKVMNLQACEVMKKEIITISPGTPILRASAMMLVKRINQLPVIKDGILIGIISHGDIFRNLVAGQLPAWRKMELYNRFAHHYDILIEWEKRVPLELPFLLAQLHQKNAKKILDIGCGTGEHALALARNRFKVVGIDQSEEMIAVANEKKDLQEKNIRDRLEFARISLGDIWSKMNQTFDSVICLGNVLPHSMNLLNDLKDINLSLKKGGILILQCRNYDKILKNQERVLNIDFRQRNEKIVKELIFIRFIDVRDDGYLNFNIATMAKEDKGWKSWGIETTTQLPVTKKMLEEALLESGFDNLKFASSFQGGQFSPLKSSELVVTAIKS